LASAPLISDSHSHVKSHAGKRRFHEFGIAFGKPFDDQDTGWGALENPHRQAAGWPGAIASASECRLNAPSMYQKQVKGSNRIVKTRQF